MKIRIDLFVVLIVCNGSFFSAQSSLENSLREFKNKSEKLLEILKQNSAIVHSDIKKPSFDLGDKTLTHLGNIFDELYEPINANINRFINNLEAFKDFSGKHSVQTILDEAPQQFNALLDFPLLNEEHSQKLIGALNALSEYGVNNKSTISFADKQSIKTYLQGIAETLKHLYLKINVIGKNTDIAMHNLVWRSEYASNVKEKRLAYDWYRKKVYFPLVLHAIIPLPGDKNDWLVPASSRGERFHFSILNNAIQAFN